MTRKSTAAAPPVARDPARAAAATDRAAEDGWLKSLAVAVILGLAIGVVYRSTLHAPFLFDDRMNVLGNPSIVRLWPLVGTDVAPGPLDPPKDSSTAGRPLVNWTLAVNYHFGKLDPLGYHLVNMALHGLSAMLVWGIVRRTLRLDFFSGRFAGAVDAVALLSALLWAVHPLNTEAVVYTSQRTELMMALFYLATLYASLRYRTSTLGKRRIEWGVAAVCVCLLGMACKEVMVSAPVMVLLFDRTFIAGTFRRALRASGPLYAGLAATWLLLFLLHHGGPRSESVGFDLGVQPQVWWATQAKALLLYLKLTVWPWPLSIHYELTYLDTLSAALPYVLPVAVLAIVTVWLVWRQTAAGFVLTWMFAILSPTLVVPIVTEIAVERRMYLPLTALTALAVASGYVLLSRIFGSAPATQKSLPFPLPAQLTLAFGAALAIVFAVMSVRRLEAYADTVTIWQDAIAHFPASNVINANLASELLAAGRPDEALVVSRQAVERGCNSRGIYNNLGAALTALGDRDGYRPGQLEEAVARFHEALRVSPDFEDALVNLSFALLKGGQAAEALAQCARAVKINPRNSQALYAQGTILMALGRGGEAAESFQRALEQDPSSAAAHYGLALILLAAQRSEEGVRELEAARQLDPRLPEVHYALAGVLAQRQDWRGAQREYQTAIDLRPFYPQAINNLGVVQMKLGETDSAIRSFAEAARQDPTYAEAQANLARAQEVKRQDNVGQER
jgi:tetratricopeptide (TPR) repeat protein